MVGQLPRPAIEQDVLVRRWADGGNPCLPFCRFRPFRSLILLHSRPERRCNLEPHGTLTRSFARSRSPSLFPSFQMSADIPFCSSRTCSFLRPPPSKAESVAGVDNSYYFAKPTRLKMSSYMRRNRTHRNNVTINPGPGHQQIRVLRCTFKSK